MQLLGAMRRSCCGWREYKIGKVLKMPPSPQIGTVGGGTLGVTLVLVVGGLVLWHFWDELADWAKVVLLMIVGALVLFGELIAFAIDTDDDFKKK